MRGRFRTVMALITALSATLVVIGLQQAANAVPLAFPGAEGYGANSVGGRGGTVCQVTNLNDSGAGSLRACINASGPRYVVFKTGGTINLQTRLEISNPYITIAGQTAPGDGITLKMASNASYDKGTMNVYTHDVVIRFIRFRPGDPGSADDSHDALAAYESGGDVYNLVFDHNSFSWGVDEVVNFYYDSRDITFSNNIVAEGLSNAGHPDGEHSKGFLSGGGGTTARHSIFRNLFVNNTDRNPQISGVPNADIRNNVAYNYGSGSGHGVTLISSSKGNASVNIVNNYYKAGPDSPANRADYALYEGDTGCSHVFYAAGNKHDEGGSVTAGTRGTGDTKTCDSVSGQSSEIAMSPVTTLTAEQAKTEVLANAGASKVRDAVDTRLVNQFNNGTGSIIDSPSEVGGWPTLATGSPWTDSDNDGMSDAAEATHGGTPNGDADGDGYTNIEEWFAELAGDDGGSPPPPPTNNAPSVSAGPNATVTLPNTASLDGTVSDDGLPSGSTLTQTWSKVSGPGTVTFGDASAVDTTASFSVDGTYELRLTADDGALTASDDVTVTVNPAAANTAPFVDAGPDKTVEVGDPNATPTGGNVLLEGVVSDAETDYGDLCGDCHSWDIVSWPGTGTPLQFTHYDISDFDDPMTIAKFFVAGTWVLELYGSDGELSATDQVTVTVTDSNPPPPSNTAPVANAGADFSVEVNTTTALAGSGSDADSDPLTYSWSKTSGPGVASFTDNTSATSSVTFDTAGTYVLALEVSDGTDTDTDSVTVTVTDPPTPPPADATNLNCPVVANPLAGDTVVCTFE